MYISLVCFSADGYVGCFSADGYVGKIDVNVPKISTTFLTK
jgi:hypothetical protein